MKTDKHKSQVLRHKNDITAKDSSQLSDDVFKQTSR